MCTFINLVTLVDKMGSDPYRLEANQLTRHPTPYLPTEDMPHFCL